jgi:polar amino acid transport system substrate-binding protein
MRLKSMVLAVLVLTSVVFAGCTKSQSSGGLTIKDGVLMIGMEIGYPPMEYYADNGSPIGFDVEMGKAIAEKMGFKAEFVDTGWDGIFASVDTGKFDCIISSVTITPARLDAHNFSKPYINTLAMVLLKGSSITARSPMECTGLNVTYQDETTSDFYMQDLRATGLNFNVFEYEKVMYCFDELRLGRVDVIIIDLLVAYEYIAQPNSPFEMVWESSDPEQFGISA